MKARQIVVLAGRNLLRHGRRTVITASAVAFGLMMYLLVDSLLLGVEEESNRNILWYETGVAQVIHEEYLPERDDHPLNLPVENPERIEAELAAAGLASTGRTVFSAELIVFQDPYEEDGSIPVIAYGIDPERDDRVFRLAETLAAGSLLSPGENGALLGAWLAEDIGAEVGFPVTLVTRTREGFFQTIDLEVVGLLETPNPLVNRYSLFLPLDVAGDYLQMDGAVTEIAVSAGGLTEGLTTTGQVVAQMEEELAGFSGISVVDWRTLAADAVAIAEAKESGSSTILFLVFIIAAVGVSNTVLMSVMERTRELGMMRAIGMRDREVSTTLLLEAGGIGLLGGLTGIVLGAVVVALMVEVGIDYTAILRSTDVGYRVTGRMYGAWHLAAFGQALIAGVVVSMVTAIVPVRRAVRMSVIDALRAQ